MLKKILTAFVFCIMSVSLAACSDKAIEETIGSMETAAEETGDEAEDEEEVWWGKSRKEVEVLLGQELKLFAGSYRMFTTMYDKAVEVSFQFENGLNSINIDFDEVLYPEDGDTIEQEISADDFTNVVENLKRDYNLEIVNREDNDYVTLKNDKMRVAVLFFDDLGLISVDIREAKRESE